MDRKSNASLLRNSTWVALLPMASCVAPPPGGRITDQHPGAVLTRHLGDAGGDLHVSTEAVINGRSGSYVALVYHQIYPRNSGDRHTSYALLKRDGSTHKVVFDAMASDSGSFTHESPFLYKVDRAEMVAFSACYRGCTYTFIRLGDHPAPVSVEPYDRLEGGEQFTGRGDVYQFNPGGLVISRKVSRADDPSCCPSGGTLNISYTLVGNQFRISSATRTE